MAKENEPGVQPQQPQPRPQETPKPQPQQPRQPQPQTEPPQRPASEPEKKETDDGTDHPVTGTVASFREVVTMVKSKAAGVNEQQRVADILRKLADACEGAGDYAAERGSGFDDKPLGAAAEGKTYDQTVIKALRHDMRTLLNQVRQSTQTNPQMIAASRASRPASLSPEIELLLSQLISALLSRFFGGMRFESEEADEDAGRVVTRPEPRTRALAPKEQRHLTR